MTQFDEAQAAARLPGERMVTVCAECLCASCWHGIFMCAESVNANVVDKPVSELLRLGREHPDYFSEEAVRRNCGDR